MFKVPVAGILMGLSKLFDLADPHWILFTVRNNEFVSIAEPAVSTANIEWVGQQGI